MYFLCSSLSTVIRSSVTSPRITSELSKTTLQAKRLDIHFKILRLANSVNLAMIKGIDLKVWSQGMTLV